MSGHAGRCFRDPRRTKRRLAKQGRSWDWPIRHKVAAELRPFMDHAGKHATFATIKTAIMRFAQVRAQNLMRKAQARGR